MFRLGLIRSKPCTRCGLEVNYLEPECPHCKGLSDLQVVFLKKSHRDDLRNKNSDLIAVFWKLTLVAFFITLLLFIF